MSGGSSWRAVEMAVRRVVRASSIALLSSAGSTSTSVVLFGL
jgi:hypothetical protein